MSAAPSGASVSSGLPNQTAESIRDLPEAARAAFEAFRAGCDPAALDVVLPAVLPQLLMLNNSSGFGSSKVCHVLRRPT